MPRAMVLFLSITKRGSFGGDMVADAAGNLYLFSAYQAIFKIDVTGKTAAYIGGIKNLPAGYTTNGAAVDDQGDLIVSSAIPGSGYYKVNMNTWEAVKIETDNKTASVSDLASGHFAFQQKKTTVLPVAVTNLVNQASIISIYPNPVTASAFQISFTNREAGRYMLQLVAVNGSVVLEKPLTLVNRQQTTAIAVACRFSQGCLSW